MEEQVLTPDSSDQAYQAKLATFQQQRDNYLSQPKTPYPVNPSINSTFTGNYLTGPNPNPTKNPGDALRDLIGSSDQWANDPNSYARPVSFGAGSRDLNFDRYYNSPGFKNLGFSPFRDNEAVYNSKTSWFSDFARAMPQVVKLTGLGFRDMLSEWTSWGNHPDVEHSEEMMKAMGIGNSSRGGAGGWITNFGVNLGYTLGITAEMAAEELALVGIDTVGGFGIGLPAGVARAGKWAGNIADLLKGSKGVKNTAETLKGINSIQDAERLTAAAKFGKEAFDFINPLENTTKFLKEAKGFDNYKDAVKGAAALYRDARLINAVASESKLEGGTALVDQTDKLVNDFYEENGRLPEGKEVEKIHQTASKTAFAAIMSNVPLIFLTDKIIFDTALEGAKILKPGARVAAEEIAKGTGKRVVAQASAEEPVKVVPRLSKDWFKVRFHPSKLFEGSLKYTSANLAQGIQENAQDIIQDTLKDYYNKQYKDPTLASLSYSLGRGLMGQMSAQGLDTFFSGFLMGGVIHGIQGPLINGITQLSKKIFTPAKYQQWVDDKNEHLNNFVNIMNDVAKNKRKYEAVFNNTDNNFTSQKTAGEAAVASNLAGDTKGNLDAKDESAFHSAYWLLKNGYFNHLQDLVDHWKTLTPAQLTEAFNKGEGPDSAEMDITKRLSSFEKKINQVKNIYEKHIRDIPNPIDYKQAKQEGNDQALKLYNDFEDYQMFAVFNHFNYERATDRINSIYQRAVSDPAMAKISGGQFSILYSPADLEEHLKTLGAEIKSSKGLDNPRDIKEKQKTYDLLLKYKDHLDSLQALLKVRGTAKEDKTTPIDQHITNKNHDLYDSFKDYIHHLAKNQPVLDSTLQDTFKGIKDYYELVDDHYKYARAINALSNPKYVSEIVQRWIPGVREQLDKESINTRKKALEEFFAKGAINELFNRLHEKGILFETANNESLTDIRDLHGNYMGMDFVAKGEYPPVFVDEATRKPIPLNSERGHEAVEIIDQWLKQTGRPIPKDSWIHKYPIGSVTFNTKVKTNVLPEYQGKIIYATPGAGKTTFVSKNPDVIDADDLLIKRIRLIPGYENTNHANIGDTLHTLFNKEFDQAKSEGKRWSKADSKMEALYNDTWNEMKQLAGEGKTVLTGSQRFIKNADVIFVTSNDTTLEARLKHKAEVVNFRNKEGDQLEGKKFITLNNSKGYENALDLALTTKPKEVVIEEKKQDDLADDLARRAAAVTSLEELEAFTNDLKKLVREGKITGDQLDAILENKRSELIRRIDFNTLNVGDKVIMHNRTYYGVKGYGTIVAKTKDSIHIKRGFGKSHQEFLIFTPAEIETEISMVYKQGMTEEDINPAPSEELKETAEKNNDKNPTTTPEIIDSLDEAKKLAEDKSEDELGEDLHDKSDCE